MQFVHAFFNPMLAHVSSRPFSSTFLRRTRLTPPNFLLGSDFMSRVGLSLFLWFFVLFSAHAQQKPEIVLTNIYQVRSLTPAEAQEHHRVNLQATVCYCDRQAGMMFIFDQTGGIFLNPEGLPKTLQVGDKLEVAGFAES